MVPFGYAFVAVSVEVHHQVFIKEVGAVIRN